MTVFEMPFGKVYQALVNKALRKGRTQEEVDALINWVCGYENAQIKAAAENEITYGDFFRQAPAMNPDRFRVKGTICKVKIQEIEDPLMKDIRILDKLVDDLAKGKSLAKLIG